MLTLNRLPPCQPWVRTVWALVLLSATAVAGAPALQFTLPDLQEQPVRLTDFHGRWVVVNFWATWCAPCVEEMPELQAFHDEQRDRAAVIGVNFESRTPDKIRAFVDELAITFPIVLSGGQPVPGFDLRGLPTTFLISPTGELTDTHLGLVNAAMLVERLDELEAAAAR
jgi:thiol-disulfide isomerase/thioredoxin